MKRSLLVGILIALLLAGCGQMAQETIEKDLELKIKMTMQAEGKLDISAGLHNPRKVDYQGTESFNGLLEVLNEAGEVRTSGETYSFSPLAGGETSYPLTYQLTLDPGTYTVRYSALGKEPLEVQFEILDKDGTLYLRAPGDVIDPFTEYTSAR